MSLQVPFGRTWRIVSLTVRWKGGPSRTTVRKLRSWNATPRGHQRHRNV